MTLKELRTLVQRGEIDTVLTVVPDMLGRLMGKRVTGRFFLDSVAQEGQHACAYLLTVDMEMQPVPGYALTSWDRGYNDFHMKPDFSTLRAVPWLEKTALVMCDLYSEEGEPIEVSPRRILQRQIERARKLGFEPYMGSELEFFIFKDTYEEAQHKGFAGLRPIGDYIEDYHILQGTKEEFVVRELRNKMDAAGIYVEGSKGEWGRGQQELNLRYDSALRMADHHTIYKHGAKEIAFAKGCSITFMAKYDNAQAGSSFHLHSSLWKGKANAFWDAKAKKPSALFWHYLAGQLELAPEFSICFAPTINSYKRYEAASFAPTRLAWGIDNRTCGFRLVGEGDSLRPENRIPGADANPYLAFAATIAAGLHGIEKKLKAPAQYKGDAYKDDSLKQVPKSLRDAADLWEGSKAAKAAFGAEVHEHYLHAARVEVSAFNKAVTDWELKRNFERI